MDLWATERGYVGALKPIATSWTVEVLGRDSVPTIVRSEEQWREQLTILRQIDRISGGKQGTKVVITTTFISEERTTPPRPDESKKKKKGQPNRVRTV
jgi:hypothetical protein